MKTAISLALLAGLAGCVIGTDADPPLSRDEFEARYIGVTHDDDGTARLYYDWDQPLDSADQVDRLYEAYVAAKTGGETLSEATVNTNIYGQAVYWTAATAANLTYCVSNSFGGYKASVTSAMTSAGNAWSNATGGRVRFVHRAEYDGTCNSGAPVVFDVRPAALGGPYAIAFFPGQARASRNVRIDVARAFSGDYPFVGILRHELGHTLGLRHETTRNEAVARYGAHCFENIYHRPLTAYDELSVMTTPACMGANLKNKSLTLSARDVAGIRLLY